VDDHPMTRAGLVHLINHQPDLVVCGEAENAG
jgi:DNA-binding NarL/FixJ family response regulator